jgi:uncharacterized protein (TIGR02271 family)
MSSTLVAVFDEYSEAQKAYSKLQAAGIDKQLIQINGEDAGIAAQPATQGSDPDDRPGPISRFFSDLFGTSDASDATNYSEAMRRGNTVLTVTVADDSQAGEISDILDQCGAIDVDERAQQWQSSGAMPTSSAVMPAASKQQTAMPGAGDNDTLKVVAEDLKVGTRTVKKGNVRIHSRLVETPVEEQVALRDERASIERVKVDRPATEADLQTAFKDKSIDIQETTQEAVVSKSARVVEEVKVGKTATERTETVRDTVKHTEVDIEKNADVGGMSGSTLRYTGAERRVRNNPNYSGAERRMSA